MTTTMFSKTSTVSGRPWLRTAVSLGNVLMAVGLLMWLLSRGRLDFSSLLGTRRREYVWWVGGGRIVPGGRLGSVSFSIPARGEGLVVL